MTETPDAIERFGEVICLALTIEKHCLGLDADQVVYALALLQATYIASAADVTGEDPEVLALTVADQVRRYVEWLGSDMGMLFKNFDAAMHARQNRGPVC